jgi:hypothetical protein
VHRTLDLGPHSGKGGALVGNGDQRAADGAQVVVALPTAAGAGPGKPAVRAAERAHAVAARRRSEILAARLRAAQREARETMQSLRATSDRAETIRELWRAASADRLRHSAYARLHARLVSLPVIEQAKGIIMAQCGCPEDQAFDALRRASQRENIKVRDLAARIVANTARSAPPKRQVRTTASAAKRSAGPEVVPAGTGTIGGLGRTGADRA